MHFQPYYDNIFIVARQVKKCLQFQPIYVNIFIVERQVKTTKKFGALAQLGERYTGSVEVSGSIPLCSTKQVLDEHLIFQRLFCNKGGKLIQKQTLP